MIDKVTLTQEVTDAAKANIASSLNQTALTQEVTDAAKANIATNLNQTSLTQEVSNANDFDPLEFQSI